MNYIKEINAFYNELEINSLSSSAIALWYALMHMNNKSGWKEEFSVPVGTLSLKSGLSERSVSNARNELKTKGYIQFKSRSGNRSAIYKMKPLSVNIADNLSGNASGKLSDNVSDYASDNLSALFKHKQNNNNQPPAQLSPFKIFTDYGFGRVDEITADILGDLVDTYGDKKVVEAMKEAATYDKRNLGYVRSILSNTKKKQTGGKKDNLAKLDEIFAKRKEARS